MSQTPTNLPNINFKNNMQGDMFATVSTKDGTGTYHSNFLKPSLQMKK